MVSTYFARQLCNRYLFCFCIVCLDCLQIPLVVRFSAGETPSERPILAIRTRAAEDGGEVAKNSKYCRDYNPTLLGVCAVAHDAVDGL